MARNDTTSSIIDGLLKFLLIGGVLSTAVIAPNAMQALAKPLKHYLTKMDARSRKREMRRIIRYMKSQNLVQGTYEHGLTITPSGRTRAEKADFNQLQIHPPQKWDRQWRIVLFDIPETQKQERDALTDKLKLLGFKQLQRSVWVHPFYCRRELEIVALNYEISQYVTYMETTYIDNQEKLIKKFSSLLN